MNEATEVRIGPRTITIDGHDLSDLVSAVDVEALPGKPVNVTLHVLVRNVIIDEKATIKLPDVTVHALRQLGWTPPAEDTA